MWSNKIVPFSSETQVGAKDFPSRNANDSRWEFQSFKKPKKSKSTTSKTTQKSTKSTSILQWKQDWTWKVLDLRFEILLAQNQQNPKAFDVSLVQGISSSEAGEIWFLTRQSKWECPITKVNSESKWLESTFLLQYFNLPSEITVIYPIERSAHLKDWAKPVVDDHFHETASLLV